MNSDPQSKSPLSSPHNKGRKKNFMNHVPNFLNSRDSASNPKKNAPDREPARVREDEEELKKYIQQKGYLDLHKKGLPLFPRVMQMKPMMDITHLNIRENGITELDMKICQNLPCLERLDLQKNRLQHISSSVYLLERLKTLRLDFNLLEELPDEISRLSALEQLSVSHNKLTQLPPSFAKLRKLKRLNISENNMRLLRSDISELQALESLYLHGNAFCVLPTSFQDLENLRSLSLEWFIYTNPGKPKAIIAGRGDSV